jgi:hypothetical protein
MICCAGFDRFQMLVALGADDYAQYDNASYNNALQVACRAPGHSKPRIVTDYDDPIAYVKVTRFLLSRACRA